MSIENMQIIYKKKVTHSIKCRLIIRQILNCDVGVSSTIFAVMRCLLLFILRCWQGPLLVPSRKTWELHFFQLTNLFHTRFIPVWYPLKASKVMRDLKKHKYIYTHSTLNMSFTHSRINASHVFNLYIYNSVRLLWLKSSARIHRNYLINELNWKSIFSSCIIV